MDFEVRFPTAPKVLFVSEDGVKYRLFLDGKEIDVMLTVTIQATGLGPLSLEMKVGEGYADFAG